ncbi:MAG TPA: hypothetical protein GXZ75_09840 [Clostridia bacterium]|jgi:hypothetical protein|nr:hypothetical protein [Clostridia bacterium]
MEYYRRSITGGRRNGESEENYPKWRLRFLPSQGWEKEKGKKKTQK